MAQVIEIANPDSGGRRRDLALLHHVEMGVEGRAFVSGGLRQAQLLAQRLQMPRRNGVVAVLDQVQIFDEEVVAPGPVAEERPDLLERFGIELAPLGEAPRTLARAGMSCRPVGTAIARGLLLHATNPFPLEYAVKISVRPSHAR